MATHLLIFFVLLFFLLWNLERQADRGQKAEEPMVIQKIVDARTFLSRRDVQQCLPRGIIDRTFRAIDLAEADLGPAAEICATDIGVCLCWRGPSLWPTACLTVEQDQIFVELFPSEGKRPLRWRGPRAIQGLRYALHRVSEATFGANHVG